MAPAHSAGPTAPLTGRAHAAFFDLDRTLLSGSSLLALSWPLYRAGFISAKTLLRGGVHQAIFARRGTSRQRERSITEDLRPLIAGVEVAPLRAAIIRSLDRYVVPRLFPAIVDLLRAHQERGDLTYIVSASPREIVEPIAAMLGATGAIATEAEVVNGRYTGNVPFYCHGEKKAERIRAVAAAKGIDLAASSAYSDGVSDLPMLLSVGHPVCVNPDRSLRRQARAHHWTIVTCKAVTAPLVRTPSRLVA